jgi:hypothetical protein
MINADCPLFRTALCVPQEPDSGVFWLLLRVAVWLVMIVGMGLGRGR